MLRFLSVSITYTTAVVYKDQADSQLRIPLNYPANFMERDAGQNFEPK